MITLHVEIFLNMNITFRIIGNTKSSIKLIKAESQLD